MMIKKSKTFWSLNDIFFTFLHYALNYSLSLHTYIKTKTANKNKNKEKPKQNKTKTKNQTKTAKKILKFNTVAHRHDRGKCQRCAVSVSLSWNVRHEGKKR